MKMRGFILYGCGILAGWWIAAIPATKAVVERWRAGGGTKMAAEASSPGVPEGLPRRDDGQILVSAEKLQELLGEHQSPILRADDFSGERSKESLELLAKWLGLDTGAKEQLAGILHRAAEERFAWEKANARITKPEPYKWVLEIPGDGGASRAALMAELKESFGEKVETIVLAADLESFFELPNEPYAKESRSGPIEIEAAKFTGGRGDTDMGELFVRIGENNTSVLRSGQEAVKGIFLTRIGHLLPGYKEMDGLARRVPLPESMREGDAFRSPFDEQ